MIASRTRRRRHAREPLAAVVVVAVGVFAPTFLAEADGRGLAPGPSSS